MPVEIGDYAPDKLTFKQGQKDDLPVFHEEKQRLIFLRMNKAMRIMCSSSRYLWV